MSDIYFCQVCDSYHDIDAGGPIEELVDGDKELQGKLEEAGYKWDTWMCIDAFAGILDDLGLNDVDEEDHLTNDADGIREHNSVSEPDDQV